MLGGPLEGIVVKNKAYYSPKTNQGSLCAKIVTKEFKEKMSKKVESNSEEYPVPTSILDALPKQALWDKAIAHLREEDLLEGTSKDIGMLIKEIRKDFLEENEDVLKEMLFDFFSKKVIKHLVKDFPDYYQGLL